MSESTGDPPHRNQHGTGGHWSPLVFWVVPYQAPDQRRGPEASNGLVTDAANDEPEGGATVSPQSSAVDARAGAALEYARIRIPGCDAVGISRVHSSAVVVTLAASQQSVAKLDALSQELREGPCWHSAWPHLTVYSPSLAHDRRWPMWGPAVAQQTALRSVLAFHISSRDDRTDVLSLYATQQAAFKTEHWVAGRRVATVLAGWINP